MHSCDKDLDIESRCKERACYQTKGGARGWITREPSREDCQNITGSPQQLQRAGAHQHWLDLRALTHRGQEIANHCPKMHQSPGQAL